MSGCKGCLSLIVGLFSLFTVQAFPQKVNSLDSLSMNNYGKVNWKPRLNYSIGSTFMVVPHLGTLTGLTVSPFLSIPLSPKLSVDGGIIAGRYYSSLLNFYPEGTLDGAFNELSIYGSANYHISSHLDIYGAGIKQITANSPFYMLPGSSYTFGSTLHFGNFSIGAALRISRWNNSYSPMPLDDTQGFYSPYLQGPGRLPPFYW